MVRIPSQRRPLAVTEEIADFVGVHPHTLRNWRHRDYGPPFLKLAGKSVRYRWEEVEKWLDANRTIIEQHDGDGQ